MMDTDIENNDPENGAQDEVPGIDLDKVCFIMIKARMFEAQEDVVEPEYGSNASDDDFRQVLEAYGDDATSQELREAIDDLNWDEQCRLVALVWIGRGTYDASQWDEALKDAEEGHSNHTAAYLIGMPLLSEYIEEGLAAFDLSCSDAEIARL